MILPFAESLDGEHGKVVWIFAGYKPDIERLFEHNPGLPSRFPVRLIFDDYNVDELGSIFASFLSHQAALETTKAKPENKQSFNVPRAAGGYGSYGSSELYAI